MSCCLLCTPILCINRPHPSFYLLVMFHFFQHESVHRSSTIYFRCFFSHFRSFCMFSFIANAEVIANVSTSIWFTVRLNLCTRERKIRINKIFKLFPLYFCRLDVNILLASAFLLFCINVQNQLNCGTLTCTLSTTEQQ